jgi:tetratricopeptide (TPR) repeat protein
MKRLIIILLALVFAASALSSMLYAASAQEEFARANHFYAEGKYQEAANLYEGILAGGTKSGELYYDLGNAYFKLAQKGKAILNYERALRLMPLDEDLFANLNFVKSLLETAQPQDVQTWHERLFSKMRDLLPPAGWFIALMIFYIVGFTALSTVLFWPGFRPVGKILAVVLFVFFLLSLLFWRSSADILKYGRPAVITVPKAEVKYSPSFSGGAAFEVTEGLRVKVLRREGEWTQIRLTRSQNGWIESNAVEEI